MASRKAAFGLVLLGLLGGAFFWATDVRFGLGEHFAERQNLTDLMTQTLPGTLIGVAVSGLIFLTGLVLLVRR